MTNQKLTETLRRLEIEQGFVAAFDRLWGFNCDNPAPADDETILEEMQRFHILYGEEYEALCRSMAIDYTLYEVE